MLLRRMLFLVALLLLVSVIAGGAVERERDAREATAPAPAPVAPRAVQQVAATLPARTPVQARVGDLVRLTVATQQPTDVTIDALGVSGSASREVPAQLDFVASDPGRYPVLSLDGAALGSVVVSR
jgi:hypothetical protein